MAPTLKAGTNTDYLGSMAEAIEQAFRAAWPKIMGNADLPSPSPDMQLLCIAIAQGVVRHLVDNAGAFKVNVSVSGGSTANATVTIDGSGGELHRPSGAKP